MTAPDLSAVRMSLGDYAIALQSISHDDPERSARLNTLRECVLQDVARYGKDCQVELADALRPCVAELVTLYPRLGEPYQSNARKAYAPAAMLLARLDKDLR